MECRQVRNGAHSGGHRHDESGRVLDAAGKPISEGIVITLSPLFDWEYTDFGTTGEQGALMRSPDFAMGLMRPACFA